ncbi:hypothetical protein TWF718_005390 [Orbilia javanica]|uniref:CBM1 domain-containing protein n=1 Tax=Orbilia javanica TaxID=47235 RepID=A0AAN8N1D6_9PEZI
MFKFGVFIGIIFQVTSAQLITPAPSQTLWGQCGGIAWTGPTICSPYYSTTPITCTTYNPYYAQCIPDNNRPTTTPAPTTTIQDCMPMLSCTTSVCGYPCGDRTLTSCVSHNACAKTTPPAPSFPVCECTTSPTTSKTTTPCTTSATTCTTFAACCGKSASACVTFCGSTYSSTIPYTRFTCTCPPTSSSCTRTASCYNVPLCCGNSTSSCVTWCSGTTPPPTPTTTRLFCTCPPSTRTTATAEVITATAIVRRVQTIQQKKAVKGKAYGKVKA